MKASLTRGYGGFVRVCKQLAGAGAILTAVSVPAVAQEVTVAILGDSLIAGYGLPEGQGIVPRLQGWLDDRNAEVTLINAGVSGDTTTGGRARLDWTLSDDVDALVVSLGGNDVLRGLPPQSARENLGAIVVGAKSRELPVLLLGFQAPLNWGPDYKQAFDSIYSDLSATHDTLLLAHFIAPLIDPETGIVNPRFLQADNLHPNPDGVTLLVDHLGPAILTLAQQAR